MPAALASLEASGALPTLDRSSSVAGDDVDGDGVRDDVGAWIDGLPDGATPKASLRALARALARALLLGDGPADATVVRAASMALSDASQCVRALYGDAVGQGRVDAVRNAMVNTRARFVAYAVFNGQAGGLATRPSTTDTCAAVLPARLATSGASAATTPSLCENRGYVVGFFNGVWNTPTDDGAYAGLAALRGLIGDTYDGEPVRYELFYNHTGSTVDATFLQDLAETFVQRARELDASGDLGGRFEFLWQVLTDGDRSLWDALIGAIPAAADLLDGLYQAVRARVAAGFSLMLSNPPTIADYAEHRSRLDEFALQGQKMLLVAHSQGNLFVNVAYDYIAPKVTPGSVRVVHIAPASPTLRGGYVLSDADLVIDELRRLEVGTVPAANLSIPVALRDLSGHKLLDTYLDPDRPGRAAVASLVGGAMSTLVTPTAEASMGFFTVTLTWDGSGDVDLHTTEPNGAHVYYAARTGASGHLDVDNTVANGPEHYFASCDPALLQVGTYTVGLNNYSGATGRTATVQVATVHGGVLLTKTLGVGAVRGSGGNASPIPVFTVTVSKDADGTYTATAQ